MTKSAKKSTIGRPRLSERGSTQLAIRFPAEIMDGIDSIVAERFGQADRTAVVRELVAEALAVREGKKK